MMRLLTGLGLLCSGFNGLQAQQTRQDTISHYEAIIPRLSPLPDAGEAAAPQEMLLNGVWKISIGSQPGDKDAAGHTGLWSAASDIKVPGEWEMQGFTVRDGETAAYSRELAIPGDWQGKRIKLRFDGVSSHCLVKVNGVQVGEHEGSFVPFEMDITGALQANGNLLEVDVQALTVSDRLACTSQYAAHTVGGILRKVRLFALPEVNIAGLTETTTFDRRFRDADLHIGYTLANETMNMQAAVFKIRLLNSKGEEVFRGAAGSASLAGGSVLKREVAFRIKSPEKWNPEHPYLYTLETTLTDHNGVVETTRGRIGFRQVQVLGNRLLVNGKPVKLHGVNRHEVYPLTGRSITPELCRKDAALFKQGNCNYIRTSHYPPSEEFLEAADELGLFVESESSLCWVGHGAAAIWNTWDINDPRFVKYMVQANVEKVIAQRNHPSVIIWSLGNESVWSASWQRVNEIVRELDPSRPTTFHDQCWGDYNNNGSKASIAVYHYPGTNGPAACDTMSRPVLFGEYAHITCYSRREVLTDPGVREAYGPPLAQMYDSIYRHDACLGGAIWSGIDDIFHMPDGRIVGYGPWGVIDAWRRTKPEYYGMKKAYSPVVITNLNQAHADNGRLLLAVGNRYDFTNLDAIRIDCKVDGVSQSLSVNIPPHGNGILAVPVASGAKVVELSFFDPGGFVAAQEKIILVKDTTTQLADAPPQSALLATAQSRGDQSLSLSENDRSFTVQQGHVTYLISKLTGIILSARKDGKEVLSQGPVCAIVPMNREDGGKSSAAGASYQNEIYPINNYPLYTHFATHLQKQQTEDSIVFSMQVTYEGAEGMQSYTFSRDGKLTVRYKLRYNGDDTLPRQYGMLMQVPKTFDRLSWARDGSFSTYPTDDIGRTTGTALLNAKRTDGVEEWGVVPAVAWKEDADELGSVDFRSTKRFITSAALTDESNDGVLILSDGTQSIRSWQQDQRLQLLVADYNNNGSEPFYGPPHSNGRKNISHKTIQGKVVLMIR